jgi:hypothetical protein
VAEQVPAPRVEPERRSHHGTGLGLTFPLGPLTAGYDPAVSGWMRPYHRGVVDSDGYALRYGVAAVMSVGGLVPLLCLAWGRPGWWGAAVVVAFVALWETVLWRVVLVGVLVGERGIKIRGVLWTHVVAWADVTRVWAGPAAAYDAWQLWASTPGRDLETPIWRAGSRARHRNRIVLSSEEFASVLNVLARGTRERNTT